MSEMFPEEKSICPRGPYMGQECECAGCFGLEQCDTGDPMFDGPCKICKGPISGCNPFEDPGDPVEPPEDDLDYPE